MITGMSSHISIRLVATEHGWVPTHCGRRLSSAASPTRKAALEDIDEQLNIADGDLHLSRATERALEETADEYDQGETTSLSELRESVEN